MAVSRYVAVIGPGAASSAEEEAAEAVGRGLAQAGVIVLTGGVGGVMAAASRGAASAGGVTVGLLPGADRSAANEWVSVAIPTGLGELRNGLLVRAAEVVIAIGGAFGTLSELALSLKTGVPVVGINTWPIDGIRQAEGPEQAVERAIGLLAGDAGDRIGGGS
jgi:uncharacterized protein (TIGR00725 family)